MTQAYQQACELKSQLPDPCLHWRYVGSMAYHLSFRFLCLGDVQESAKWIEIALEEAEAFLQRPDRDPLELMDLAACLIQKVRIERAKEKWAEAERWEADLRTKLTNWAAEYPDYHEFKKTLTYDIEDMLIPTGQ